ncbi:MAG: serine/threonine-protein kinase [Thermoanaerobaculia bacterium]|nr:serine/threonine-protein kinase [Thermoanaerobaculia bacterium]
MTQQTPLTPDSKLGDLTIREQIGSGDTGEVYRAWDPELESDIAIKILPPDLTRDPATVSRFERSIDLLAGLTHPAIARLYGYQEIGEYRVLKMELTEGVVLSRVLWSNPCEVEEAVSYAKQIASGLDHAHRRRIIHGHLQPNEIRLSASGEVKIFDFGLTRTIEMLEGEMELDLKSTLERLARPSGALSGTSYQSPEQMLEKFDERTDIWALGIILWEMLVGINPFLRGSISETAKAIVKEEPDWTSLPETVPPHVRRALQLSLRKSPSKRLRSAADFTIELTTPIGDLSTL